MIQRMKEKFINFVSSSQNVYLFGRSIANIVWVHRWITAKVQNVDSKLHQTGIEISSAFDTINRKYLLQIIKTNFDKDVNTMTRALLSNTTLEIKLQNANTISFASNKDSPQGNGISGILFNTYLEDSLRQKWALPRTFYSYAKVTKTKLLEEIISADDINILKTDKVNKVKAIYRINNIFPERCLMNNNKYKMRRKQLSITAVNLEKVWIKKYQIIETH